MVGRHFGRRPDPARSTGGARTPAAAGELLVLKITRRPDGKMRGELFTGAGQHTGTTVQATLLAMRMLGEQAGQLDQKIVDLLRDGSPDGEKGD